jgi:hypothetical protein
MKDIDCKDGRNGAPDVCPVDLAADLGGGLTDSL